MDDTWQRCMEHFLDSIHNMSGSDSSLRNYRLVLHQFFDQDKSPEDYTKEDVEAFLKRPSESTRSKGQPIKTSTRNLRLSVLSSFYTYAATYTLPGPDGHPTPLMQRVSPTLGLHPGKREKHYKALSLQEFDQFFSVIPTDTLQGLRDRAIFLTYFWTARRREEIGRLRYGDIEYGTLVDRDGNQHEGYLYHFIGKGKSRQDDVAELPLPAWQAIERYLETSGRKATIQADDPLFVPVRAWSGRRKEKETGKEPLTTWYINALMKEYCAMAGLDVKRLSLHSWRHTAAQQRRKAGQDIIEIKDLLRHESLDTTYRYLLDLAGTADTGASLLQEKFARFSM